MEQESRPVVHMIDEIGLVAIAGGFAEQPFLNRCIAGRQGKRDLTPACSEAFVAG